jgi:general stress protein YciG
MDGEKQRTIASKGGRAAHAKGTAHEWSSEEARAAGRKGGESRGSRNRIYIEHTTPNSAPAEFSLSADFLQGAGSLLRGVGNYSSGINTPADSRSV